MTLKGFLKFGIVLLLGSCVQAGDHQEKPVSTATLTTDQLREDFKVFRASLEEIHPGLYSFVSKDSLDLLFDKTFSQLDRAMTKEEFFRLLSPLILKIYDEHTSLDFSYRYPDLRKFLPFKVRFVNTKAYIQKNLSGLPSLLVGSELLSINGRDIKSIYSEIIHSYPNFTTDLSLEYDVYSLHFDYLYASFFEQPDSFDIVAVDPQSKAEYRIKCPSLSVSDTARFLPLSTFANEFVNADSCYQFKIIPGKDAAILKISSFSPGCANFNQLFHQDFSTLQNQGIKNLVIDLRYNRGGDPKYGATLLTYLYNKPFHIFDSLSAILTKKPTYYTCIDTSDITFGTWAKTIEALSGIENKKRNWYTAFRDTVFEPQKQLFTGKVYLLVNSDVHSAAHITAALFDYHVHPTIIGSPVCGPYNSGNALDMLTLTLPHSKLNVIIPLVFYRYAIPPNLYPYKKGIDPDMYIKPSISDIIANKDIVLDSTLSIIRSTAGH